jgi:hypothetical protein
MGRVLLGSLLGMLVGVAATAGLLWAAGRVVDALRAPKELAMEPSTIYLGTVLGAGLGAICGALAGLASALTRALRAPSPPPPSPPPQAPAT